MYVYIYIYIHTHTYISGVLLLCQSGWTPAEEQKVSDPDLNQVSLRVAWYSLPLGLTRQKYGCFHSFMRIILRNVMPCILVGTYHHFGCIDCSTVIHSIPGLAPWTVNWPYSYFIPFKTLPGFRVASLSSRKSERKLEHRKGTAATTQILFPNLSLWAG